MHYLYKITNQINGKIYIGQTINPDTRWKNHQRSAIDPKVPIQYAIKKYDVNNFEFEVIACCKNQDDTNDIETELIKQYNSFIANGSGYNATHGGMNAPKSENFKQMMRAWHASLSPEEKEKRKHMHRKTIINLIATKGHPAQGLKWTREQRDSASIIQKAVDRNYSLETRQKMSKAHIGLTDSEETKKKKSESITKSWQKRYPYNEVKCAISDCEIRGKHHYIILNNIRYCSLHGQRIRNNGTIELLPPFKYSQDNPMPEEIRKKCGLFNIGRTPHNKVNFTNEQIMIILNDNRSLKKIAQDLGVNSKVIKRIKLEAKSLMI